MLSPFIIRSYVSHVNKCLGFKWDFYKLADFYQNSSLSSV